MPRKPHPKSDDPAEYERFLETAKEAEASDDPRALEKAFKRVVRPISRPSHEGDG